MEIPWDRLSPEALRALARDVVTRDGTDYGAAEVSEDQKVEEILRALEKGDAVITFDPATETCAIVHRDALRAGRPRS